MFRFANSATRNIWTNYIKSARNALLGIKEIPDTRIAESARSASIVGAIGAINGAAASFSDAAYVIRAIGTDAASSVIKTFSTLGLQKGVSQVTPEPSPKRNSSPNTMLPFKECDEVSSDEDHNGLNKVNATSSPNGVAINSKWARVRNSLSSNTLV